MRLNLNSIKSFNCSGAYRAAFLFLLVILIVVQSLYWQSFSKVEEESFYLDDLNRTRVVRYSYSDWQEQGAYAILLHGKRCSAQMMSPFSHELARRGITTYTFDFPGHGHSLVPMRFSCPLKSSEWPICYRQNSDLSLGLEIVKKIIELENLHNKKVFLIGHSFGGGRIGQALMRASEPNGLDLYLINLDGSINGMAYSGTNQFTLLAKNSLQRRMSQGRSIQTNISHLEMIYSSKVIQLVLGEVARVLGFTSRDISEAGHLFYFGPVLVVLALLSLYYLGLVYLKAFFQRSESFEYDREFEFRVGKFAKLLSFSVVAAVFCRLATPYTAWFRLFNTSENLFLIYLIILGWLWGLYILVRDKFLTERRGLIIHDDYSCLMAILVGTIAFAPFALILAPYLDSHLYHAGFRASRFLRLLTFWFGFFPLNWAMYCKELKGFPSTKIFSLRVGLWFSVLGVWFLFEPHRPADRSSIGDLIEYFTFVFVIGLFCLRFEKNTKSPLSSAVFATFFMAWSAAFFYPVYSM